MSTNKNKKSRIKYDIRNGQLITKGKVNKRTMTPEQREYTTYKNLAKKANVPDWEIFKPTQYRTAIAGDKARGYPGTPQDIARRQAQNGLTENQLKNWYETEKKRAPKKFNDYEDYRRSRGWKIIDAEIDRLRDANPGMDSLAFRGLVTRTIFSPPLE